MDGSLPTSLKHIISNAEYYGPSLFLLATEVVTLYVFHEPSQLSSLQDRKLTDVILDALVLKEVGNYSHCAFILLSLSLSLFPPLSLSLCVLLS